MVSIKELKKALSSNDQQIIEDIYERIYIDYYKLIYYIIIKIVKDQESCKELVNDVFLKAFNNIDKLDLESTSSSLKSWLVRIAKNESLNYLTKEARNKISIDEEVIEKKEAINNDNFFVLLDEFKEFLTDEELDILIFRIYYDLTLKEIAEYYNSTTGIIYTKYQKALKILKQYYKKGDF